MKIIIYGFGKMGKNLALNVLEAGYDVVGYDIDVNIQSTLTDELYATPAFSWASNETELFQTIQEKDVIFLLVPPGHVTNQVLAQFIEYLPKGVTVIEGGNSHYEEAKEWAKRFEEQHIHFLDMGTSGGLAGARHGLCAMVGGNREVFDYVKPLLESICCENGLLYAGEAGSGHYLKMIHNGIEYGMMQSIAEGFELLDKSEYPFQYQQIATNWNSGSVIRSWLLELLADAFENNEQLDDISSKMHASGEVKWLMNEAIRLQTPMPVIYSSLMMRNRSLEDAPFGGKVVSALRNSFGGHHVSKDGEK